MEATKTRQAIIVEAMSWCGTPYRHMGDIKGIGVDCAMLLIRVYGALGFVPSDYDPRPYSPEWYFHRTEELYLAGMEKYSHRVECPQPGDIAVYRFGKTASHGAIIVDNQCVVHAHRPDRSVTMAEMRAGIFLDPKGKSRLHSYWSVLS